MSTFDCILDASALLAVLNREPGAGRVEPLLVNSAISAVNWSETVQKAIARNISTDGLRQEVEALGVTIVPFTADDAEHAARLWPETSGAGLSLGDRACLALARRETIPALTTDRAWRTLSAGIDVQVIR